MDQKILKFSLAVKNTAKVKLENLKRACDSEGMPPQNRLSFLLKEPSTSLEKEEVLFLEKWLYDSDEKTSILILQTLCKFGNPVSMFYKNFPEISSRMSYEIMRIAYAQKDPDTILDLVSEDKQNVNAAIILLKRMDKKEYLASFLFSQNQELVDLIKKVVE